MNRFLLLLLLTATTFIKLNAQEKTITGKVVDDANDMPLSGATVSVLNKALTNKTTGGDGGFSFVVNGKTTLTVTYVGYVSQTVSVGENKTSIVIRLQKASANMAEVVVIGYGKQQRKDITSSISSLSGEQVSEMPVSNINMALQGRVSGLQITSAGNEPGAGSIALIRGINSININNGPLYVVDGVITTGDLREINPSDVASIDVLKDASAAAIYGARAAEGVIVITTKKARKGITALNYDGYYGVQKIITPYQFVNGQQYEQIRRQAYFDELGDPNFLHDTTSDQRFNKQLFNSLELQSIQQGKTYDWASQVLHAAPIQSHTISVSSGGDKSRIYISGNYFKQDGIIKNSNMVRYSLNANGDVELSQKLKLILNSNFSHIDRRILDQQVYYNALTMSPLMPFTDSAGNSTVYQDPTKGGLFLVNNPIALTNYPIIQNDDRYMGSLALEYKIIKGLMFRPSFNTDIYNNKKFTYYPRTININNSYMQGGYGAIENFDYRDYTSENILTYDYNPNNDHSLSALAGFTYESRRQGYNYMSGTGFPSDKTGYKDMSLATNKQLGSNFFNWSLVSEIARVIYKYRQRYIINASIRRDGSSFFGENNRYGTFPSVSAAWRLIDEPFMNSIKLKSVITDAKLRAGYGVIGNYNQNYKAIFSAMAPSGYPFDNTQTTTGFQIDPSYLENKNLKWEQQQQFNIGADLAFLNDRLGIVADFYNKNIKNMLLDVDLPASNGFQRQTINIARMNTRGVDIKIRGDIFKSKNFQWQMEVNWSAYTSKITHLLPGIDSLRPDLKVGEAPNSLIIDYVYDGLYQAGTSDSTLMNTLGIKPGSVKVRDLNKDGKFNQYDMTIVGRTTPKGWGGIWSYMNYKGFSLIVFANYMYGHSIFNKAYQDYLYPDGHRVNLIETMNYWTPTNTNTDVPRPNGWGNAVKTLPGGTSSFAVQKGDYIKIRNITIGYDFQSAVLNKLKVRSLNVYVQFMEPFMITGYKGVDPETSQLRSGVWSGSTYDIYPRYKTTLVGLKLGL